MNVWESAAQSPEETSAMLWPVKSIQSRRVLVFCIMERGIGKDGLGVDLIAEVSRGRMDHSHDGN